MKIGAIKAEKSFNDKASDRMIASQNSCCLIISIIVNEKSKHVWFLNESHLSRKMSPHLSSGIEASVKKLSTLILMIGKTRDKHDDKPTLNQTQIRCLLSVDEQLRTLIIFFLHCLTWNTYTYWPSNHFVRNDMLQSCSFQAVLNNWDLFFKS